MAMIAAELGVSMASVSNALNRPERVSAELRARVLDVATRIGYAGAAAAARRLPGGLTRTVGVVFTADLPTALGNSAAVEFLRGLATACNGAHTSVLLVCADTEDRGGILNSIKNAVVDGFVVYSVRDDDPLLPVVLHRSVPTVIVDAPTDVTEAGWVGGNDRAAVGLIGAHLRDLGHRRVGVIAPQLNVELLNGSVTADRWRTSGYRLMRHRIEGLLESLQLDDAQVPVEERFDGSAASGAEAAHALLDRHSELTAICCLTDELALGALTAARQRDLTVPRDLTITGFDDIPEAARAGLTTVSQAHFEKGRVAGELFLSAAAGSRPQRRTLATHLQIRTTSGPPPI